MELDIYCSIEKVTSIKKKSKMIQTGYELSFLDRFKTTKKS